RLSPRPAQEAFRRLERIDVEALHAQQPFEGLPHHHIVLDDADERPRPHRPHRGPDVTSISTDHVPLSKHGPCQPHRSRGGMRIKELRDAIVAAGLPTLASGETSREVEAGDTTLSR